MSQRQAQLQQLLQNGTAALIFQLVVFYVSKPYFKNNPRGLSWLLGFFTALITSILTIPMALNVVTNGFDPQTLYTETPISAFTTTYFFVFMLLDLILGSIYYPKYVDPLSGWVHHVMFGILVVALNYHYATTLLATCFAEEIPTLLLAIGSIHKPWRQDLLFGATFFVLRICFHYLFWYHLVAHAYHDHPAAFYAAIFITLSAALQTWWFYQWTQKLPQYLQALQRTKEDKAT